MNTAQIKAYAPKARNDFIKAVRERAARFGIHGDNKFDPIEFKGDVAIIGTQVFSKKGGELREKLVTKVKQQGFEMFIRSNAYTWFNRFVAIRYMELHDFLDHGFRVLSNTNGSDIPEILEHATEVDLPGLDKGKVTELRLAGDKDNELYRMLVIAQCNALHKAMPFLFEAIDNEAELLLPDNLLHTNSPVKKMVTEIDESLWGDVEIIGWIYQFYISEKKDEVIGKVVKSEDIPAATQLFTPNWIVKYMVQNTLGRMWMATYPESSLKAKMGYYIEPAEQDPEVQVEIDRTTPGELNPEELTFLDPACGSGHILVEAYDILKEIYLERGYRTRDIPRLILKNNLYGLDIDDRAAQLACFALLMRARKDDRQLFGRDDLDFNIMSIVETKGVDKAKILDAISKREGGKGVWIWINELIELFEQAKTFGSLITIPDELVEKLDDINSVVELDRIGSDDLFNYIAGTELQGLKPIIKQTQFLSKKYDCVVANPPYMGGKNMNGLLKSHVIETYNEFKSDLYAAFIAQCMFLTRQNGRIGLVTPFVWMFLTSHEGLRKYLLSEATITSLIQLEYNSFSPACIPVTSFTLINRYQETYKGFYIKLSDFKGSDLQAPKTLEAINNSNCKWLYESSGSDFLKIPGTPIAFWISDKTRNLFQELSQVGTKAIAKQGLITGDNNQFLRFWYEVDLSRSGFNISNRYEAKRSNKKWFPFQKGGGFRKWYGNHEYFVNWYEDGDEIRNFFDKNGKLRSRPQSMDYYFKLGITWTSVTITSFNCRLSPIGFLYSEPGPILYAEDSEILYLLMGFLNSKPGNYLLQLVAPGMHYNQGHLSIMPIAELDHSQRKIVIKNVQNLKEISVNDWDSYEISWDFKQIKIIQPNCIQKTLKLSYIKLIDDFSQLINSMKELEEENNSIFIKEYYLENTLEPIIPFEEITLTSNPFYRYGKGKTEEEYDTLQLTDTMKELISYSIGCMMGRYSLDEHGLIYVHNSNIDFDPSKYKTFPADDDGIVPIMDMNWFEDDATKRFVEFIKTVWPEENLDENLKFVADSLNPKSNESSEDTIRRYLSTIFFKDHIKTYKKRPIYWLFSSGKQKAFECLVYLHRYNESTLSRMRSSYVTPLQGNISARIEFLDHEKDAATNASSQKKIQKQIDVLKKKQVELKAFDDELRHYADMRISLDLDDGVKVNYGKFGNLLAEKKAITGK